MHSWNRADDLLKPALFEVIGPSEDLTKEA